MTDGVTASKTSGCSKRPTSKAAASEEARRTLRYVEPLSDARTKLEDFFSILLERDQFEIERSFDKPGAGESDDAE